LLKPNYYLKTVNMTKEELIDSILKKVVEAKKD